MGYFKTRRPTDDLAGLRMVARYKKGGKALCRLRMGVITQKTVNDGNPKAGDMGIY